MMTTSRAACVLLAGLFPAMAGADPGAFFDYGADITYQSDDNQTRAEATRDKVEDQSVLVSGTISKDFQPSFRQLLTFRGFAEIERFDDIDTLDRNSLGLSAAWRWQPDSSFLAPIFEVSLSYQDDDIETDARDSGVTRAQAFVTRRITDRLTGTLGLEHRKRDSDGSVWDLEDSRWFMNLDLMVNRHGAAYFTFSRISGDTFSSAQFQFCNGATAPGELIGLIDGSTALEPDEAYNNALCGDWIAYRLDATSSIFTLGYNHGFSHTLSLDASVTEAQVRGENDNEYDRRLFRVTLLKRF